MSTAIPLTLTFEGRFARELGELAVPWQADEAPDPQLLVLNEPLARELGLDPSSLRTDEGTLLLIGNRVPEGATPVAQAYAGHQFGGYSPQLGDGRALLLGEVTDIHGQLRDIHLKGSGRTPFARAGDGLAVVGPMLREYIVSEAMHAMGIPTTRSLAVVATGQPVRRETILPGAVLTRVASSHLRVGSFQFARVNGDTDLLRRLADHAISRHYPDAALADKPYLAFFDAVIAAQASLVAQWMLVGFVHGVMNTDNMTISGETIDYGPCAFMDVFNPGAVYSSIDVDGRYAYGNQPIIAEWNLTRLAEALLPLLHEDQDQAVALAVESLGHFRALYSAAWSAGMKSKLGLPADTPDDVASPLVDGLLGLLQEAQVDYTSFFRGLVSAARGTAERGTPARDTQETARAMFAEPEAFDAWAANWLALAPDAELMERVNPVYVPRNHLVEEALDAAIAGDLDPFNRLMAVVTDPYTQRPGLERYAGPAPEDFGNYRTYCGT